MRPTTLLLMCLGVFYSVACTAQTTYNVKSYGAVCNGSTNDGSKIQAAINAASAAGGGIVVGPSGSECITGQTLNIPANVWISGFWIGSLSPLSAGLFYTNGGSGSCPSSLIKNVRVQDMILDGGATTSVSGSSGITLNCVTQSLVMRSTIRNVGWEGVTLQGSTDTLLKDNEFQTIYGDCAVMEDGDGDGIISNVCDANGKSTDGGFSANVNSGNVVISNNVVKGLAGSAFGIESAGAYHVVIANNVVESGYGLGNGIRVLYNLADSYDVTIANNFVGPPPSGGFCINVTKPNSSHQTNPIKITGNQCLGNSSSTGGIYVNGYSVEISSNAITIPNTGATCVLLDANGNVPAGYMTVHDNILEGCGTTVQGGTSPYFAQPMYFGSELVVP